MCFKKSNTVVRFSRMSSDDCHSERWCINKRVHVEISTNDLFGEEKNSRVRILGECDGSCQERRTDVRQLIANLPSYREDERGRLPIMMDSATVELLRGDTPICGTTFSSGYTKRESRWDSVCTGTQHVKLITLFTWAEEPDYGGEESFVSTVRCDDSCKELVKPNRRTALRILREYSKNPVQG